MNIGTTTQDLAIDMQMYSSLRKSGTDRCSENNYDLIDNNTNDKSWLSDR